MTPPPLPQVIWAQTPSTAHELILRQMAELAQLRAEVAQLRVAVEELSREVGTHLAELFAAPVGRSSSSPEPTGAPRPEWAPTWRPAWP